MRYARKSDPITSWAAALSANDGHDIRLRSIILSLLERFGPMTHDQIIRAVNMVKPATDSGVRTRVSELVRDGYVEQVPDMIVKTRYGRPALLWQFVPIERRH